jgi:hypothetical protein
MQFRSPPPLPTYLFEVPLVNPLVFLVYLWRTLRPHERHRVLLPNALQILLKLLLASTHPRGIEPLCYPDALMAKQYGDSLYGSTKHIVQEARFFSAKITQLF